MVMGMGMGVGFSSPPPWTPAALGPVGRWSATDVLTSGAAVTAFVDLGSGGHNATQALAANQAQYSAAGNPAGGPQVTFDGDDYYQTAAFEIAQPFAFVMALKPTYTADYDVYFDGLALPKRCAIYTGNGSELTVHTNLTSRSTPAMVTNNAWQVSDVLASGASSALALNGGAQTTLALTGESINGVAIGAQGGGTNGAKMVFYALDMVSRALTAGERASANSYYHSKVGA